MSDDGATVQTFEWRVDGREVSRGTMHRSVDATGVIEAEGAGDALQWILDRSDVWDSVDQFEELTVSVRPIGREDRSRVTGN